MKEALKEHLARMVMMCDAFGNFADKESSFLPEYAASKYINGILEHFEFPKNGDIEKIIEMIANTESVPHYNGSAWYDYKIHLNFLLREYDFNDFDPRWLKSQKE